MSLGWNYSTRYYEMKQRIFVIVYVSHPVCTNIRRLFSPKQNNFWLCGQAFSSFQHGLFMSEEMLDTIILYTLKVYQKHRKCIWYTFKVYNIIVSNISSDMNKPCWKLAKVCPQSQKLFCFGENNLLIKESLFSYNIYYITV